MPGSGQERVRIRVSRGPDPVKRVHIDVHLRPWEALGPYPTGTWTYPTLVPGYQGQPLGTGLRWPKIQEPRSSFAAPYPSHPLVIGPLSPGGLLNTADGRVGDGWTDRAGPVLAVVYPGRNGMALAGHLGQLLPGVPTTPVLYYILFHGTHVDAACLPSRRSFSCLALAGRPRELSPPLAAAQLVATVLAE